MADPDKPAAPVIAPADAATLPGIPSLSPTARRWHKPMFIVFLATWASNTTLAGLGVELPVGFGWVEALLPVSAVTTTLLALACRLPLQNVLMAAVSISSLATGILAVGAKTGTPFGPIVFTDSLGERLFEVVPWPLPLLWVVLIINGRGVGRLIMRPWRKTNYYGFWVIGISCGLVTVFAFGFEPFAARVKHYWLWQTAQGTPSWYTAPWVTFLGWLLTAVGIVALSIPWLINKLPVKQPMDYQPLIVWTLVNLWPAAGNASRGLWTPVVLVVTLNLIAALYAIRGARW